MKGPEGLCSKIENHHLYHYLLSEVHHKTSPYLKVVKYSPRLRRENLGSHIPSNVDTRRIRSCEYLYKQSTSPSDLACLVVRREYFLALLSDLAVWCASANVLWIEMLKVSTSLWAIACFIHSLEWEEGIWNQEIFITESWECRIKPLCKQWQMS